LGSNLGQPTRQKLSHFADYGVLLLPLLGSGAVPCLMQPPHSSVPQGARYWPNAEKKKTAVFKTVKSKYTEKPK